ncbi:MULTISPECIES: DUF1488 family protein [unclassified Bradyrhizobium]|uniref:DUF1488 family protein n=1 Tax=unclassified Bradyrhizobium TaxID=2631580 RepID=UPI0024795F91|nr:MULTISPECIES: DUF1488 family protein [unclassified Bradyrhizobium]WGR69663.1 DUF1488 domain-containing protein [Bradyrhizobium sp. ISRA426]WGR81720.1 DUF1488 domain-containing protein [Bradyrhizobium sp. ISRA430]WGR84904.1 DUF1488 domain-containing protein [Bradyrhizobium sp. ISRA432]
MPLQPDPSEEIVVDQCSGVPFAMFDGNKRGLCEINSGALADRATADGADENDIRATFHRHQRTIQAIASQNHDAGQERPIITTYQLTPLP